MPYKTSDRTLPLDTAFTLGNEQFPSNWLRLSTEEDREKRGIKWEQPPELQFKDDRFYRNWIEDGKVKSEPKELEGLKRTMMVDCRRVAHVSLAGSDWMVIRKLDVGDSIPAEWKAWRELVRIECDRQEGQITEARDVDALAAITPNWPLNPDEVAEQERREAEIDAARESE